MDTAPAPRRRAPSGLFGQLLRLQIALVLIVMLVFGALFYAERNRALATLQAELWAPVLRRALEDPAAPLPPPLIERRQEPPALSVRPLLGGPRIAALRDTLIARGVPLRELAFAAGRGAGEGAVVWLALGTPGGGTQWFALSGRLIEGAWPARLLLGLAIAAAALVAASWAFTRRLTLPLQRLNRRMQRAAPGALATDSGFGHRPAAGTPRELLEIEAAHRALMQRLEDQERERALLLAGVSHDLRSPLARIRMAAELLPDAPGTDVRRASIVRNAAVADALVGSFLDHVRAGELPLDQPTDLVALAREAVQARPGPQAELALEAPAGSLVLPRAHPQLLARVIANLLDNAFMHGRPPVRLRLASGPGEIVLEVEDGGAGVPPAERALALSAFGRGDASRHRPGSGLGLAVVRRVVERLGGCVEWIDPPRAGIRLRLPLRAE